MIFIGVLEAIGDASHQMDSQSARPSLLDGAGRVHFGSLVGSKRSRQNHECRR